MNCLSPQNVAPPFIVLTESVNALGLYGTGVGSLRSTDWFERDGPDIAVLVPPERSWQGLFSVTSSGWLSRQLPGLLVLTIISVMVAESC